MGLRNLSVLWLFSAWPLLSHSSSAAVSLSLNALDVYPPFLPKFIAQEDTIADLELRVYFPVVDMTAAATGVRVTPTCASMVFTPSSFLFDATVQSVYRFTLEPITNGTFTIEYRAQEEALALVVNGSATNTTAATANGSSVLFSQTIRVLESPRTFALSDREWTGAILRNDSFDQRLVNAGSSDTTTTVAAYSSPFWSHLMHGYPSGACGAVDGDRALYFTSLGDRFAVTSALNLVGFHGKMHFYHVYGFRNVQSYDSVGDNLISCELVDAEEETVLSYLPPGQDYLNKSAWQQIYEVPLRQQLMGNFSTHSVPLPLAAMHSAAQFRWEQKNHSSFPIDVASGLSTETILRYENDLTGVNGQLGLEEREVWRYRNLFDQWALDNVRLEVRLNVPLFSLENATLQTPGSTRVVVMSPIANSWVEVAVGNGTHVFPSCSNATRASNSNASTIFVVQLNASGYVHAVACLQVNASLISSFPTRSPRFLVQARAPRITTSLDSSTSIDKWSVTLSCDGCDFMRYILLPTTASSFSARSSPSCSYGTLANGTSLLVPVTSNAKLQVVACGDGLVGSDLVESSALSVRPRMPTFAFMDPKTTVTGVINVTIVPSDAASVGVLYLVGSATVPGMLSCAVSKSAIKSAGNLTIQVNVWDIVRAVACCMDRECEDSDVAVWGPLKVNAFAPVFSMACSRVKPLTMVVGITSVTMDAEIRYVVGSLASSSLTCASGTNYTKPIEVTMNSTTVYAISCRRGLEASVATAIPVNLDACCSGLDAYTYPSCAHVLLLADDFSNCVDVNKWTRVTSQWGGDDVNGGVHAGNVDCVKDQALGKNVLVLNAHGDLYSGTTPVGSRLSPADGVLRERTVNDSSFLEWALEGANSVPCNQRERCPARRVGAAISTKLELNAGILILRLKPCDAFGTLTQVWWGKYEDKQAVAQQQVSFLPLWKAALYQAKTTSAVPSVVSSPMSSVANATVFASTAGNVSLSEGFIEIGMQWNASEGRANLYVNGALVLKQSEVSSSTNQSISSLMNSTLSLGVWFPNAIAGEPLFESCNVLVDKVQIFKMEIAGDRWCNFDSGDTAAHTVACASDVDCQNWVTQNCFMSVYEAACVAHYDELGAFPNANAQEYVESAAGGQNVMAAARFCHFRLQPTTYSSVSSTEMTARDQLLQWSDEE